MAAAGLSEEAESSQLHLRSENPPGSIQPQPYADRHITEEQRPLTSSEESNPGGRFSYQLDHLSQAPPATGIIIRKACTYNRQTKDEEKENTIKRDNTVWVWRLELLLLFVSAGLFVSICLILDGYDNEQLPDWNTMGLTLNTLISILATFFRASIAVVTFEIIAQRKWNWISGNGYRPLRDVELFDSASRGLFGCFRLLPIVVVREPVALGAISVAVLLLGVGSFTQQSIQTYQCLRATQSQSDMATIAVANELNLESFGSSFLSPTLYPKLAVAMKDGTVSPNDFSSFYNCPSGNCTFPAYSTLHDSTYSTSHASLGICSKCVDLYDLVEQQTTHGKFAAINYSLPVDVNGQRMKITLANAGWASTDTYFNVATGMNLSWTGQVTNTSDFLRRARWSLANITFLGISEDRCNTWPDGNITCPNTCSEQSRQNGTCKRDSMTMSSRPTDYAAVSCIMYPCTRYYRAKFNNSKPEEKVVWEVPLRPQLSDYDYELGLSDNKLWSAKDAHGDWKGMMQPCLVNGTVFTSLNASSSAEKIPNPTKVVFHAEDWATESISSPPKGFNMTVPADCVVTLPRDIDIKFSDEFQFTYNFNCTVDWSGLTQVTCKTTQSDVPERISWPALFINITMPVEHVISTMESVAIRITNEFRKIGRGPFSNAQTFVKGTAWENSICVQVAWKWLIFPGSLLVISTVLLLATIARDTRRRNIWKSSILPLLLKNYSGVERMGLKDLDKTAGGLEVKLHS